MRVPELARYWAVCAGLTLSSGACGDSTGGPLPAVESSTAHPRPLPLSPSSSGGGHAAPSGSVAQPADSAVVQPADSAPVTPAPSASGASVRRSRRGVFLWEIGKNGPDAARSAELLAEWGVGRVFIKSSEGAGGVRVVGAPDAGAPDGGPPAPSATPVPGPSAPSRWAQNFRKENVAPFLARGIEVWAFGYFYPDRFVDAKGVAWGTLEEQVATSVATLHEGVTGLVVDAESEFIAQGADAKKLCKLLRQKLGKRKLAYTSFGWLSAQRRFPFEAFDAGCGDAFLPQVYWDFGWPGGITKSLERMRADVAARGLHAPVWPVQSNERNASAADLQRFFVEAGDDASIFYLHPDGTEETRRMGALAW